MKKRIWALLLGVSLLCTFFVQALPIASAAEVTYSGNCGENLTWTLDTDGLLTISGTGEMEDYSSYGNVPWMWNGLVDKINCVVIRNGVTSISYGAFWGCTGLTSVTIPDSVTSIGYGAFYGCTGLTSITIPDSVTSIGESAFRGCTGLTSVTIPDSVTSIDSYTFYGCTGLTSVTIPDSVTSIGDYAFSDCTGLSSITIPDSVMSIGNWAFNGCTGLSSITVSSGNKKYDSRNNCNGIVETATNTLISGCKNTDIPDSVTRIGDSAFYGCTGLTSVTIPDSVTSIGDYAFCNCTGLTSVTIPDSVTNIGGSAFTGCTGLTSITIPDSVTSIVDYAFYGCTGLTSVTIPDSVTWIGDHAFWGCTGLTSITIPDSVTSIGGNAFSDCTGLSSITIPDSVMSIGNWAFNGCTGLSSITVSSGNKKYDSRNNCNGIVETATNTLISGCKNTDIPDSVTSIGGSAFAGCTGLTSITIPDSVTSIGSYAFCDCTGLASITVSGGNKKYDSRNNCNGIIETATNTLISGCKNTDIPDSVTSIGEGAFRGCTGLTSITIPDSVTDIGVSAFEGCTGLISITIPDSVTSIGGVAFCDCTGLTSITIPDSVTSIGGVAFCDCTGLTSITIPDSVTAIGASAFEGCTGLTSVCFMGDAPVVNERSFQTYDEKFHAYINIPGLTLYYIEGKSGWTTPTWGEAEYPTAVWDGVNIPQPHTHSYTAVVTAPTCTEKGYTTYTCACGDSYKKDFVSALGHDFKDGTCTRCGASDPNYKPVDPTPEATFTDVSETAWYKNSVDYAVEHGLMNGTGTNTFEPESTMTRAMLVTVLWRYANAPKPGANPFTDVPNGKWYTDAVAWAAENGVVNGVGDGKFEPDGSVTREQMATILYRYAQKVGIDTSKHTELSAFPDANRVSAYARAPMQWIVAEGVIGGSRENGQDWLNPQGNATRAEVATILMRFIENVAKRPQ